MTDERGLLTIADAADALTQPIHHVERIYDRDLHRNRKLRRVYTVTLPSILDQLAAAIVPGEVYVEEGAGAKLIPQSTPPAQLEAINAILTIEAGAAHWCMRAGLPMRETATGNIRSLVGANLDSGTGNELLSQLRRWYGTAATLTGWLSPPWTPQAPCPLCDSRQLRVRLDRQTATCIGCGEAWSDDTIGLLADHCRAYTTWSAGEAKRAREEAATAKLVRTAEAS